MSNEAGTTASTGSEARPPMDRGWAWMVLLGCCLNRMLCDGVLSSLGVFIVTWQQQFPGSVTKLSWITSLVVAITYITGPVGSALCNRFSIRQVVMAGTILASVSLIAASQAYHLWHLYCTFALAGIGFGLTLQPSYVILTYYFDKRLARANGVASAGVGIGILTIPPFFQVLIDFYGWQSALLILAAVLGNLGVCAALYKLSKLEVENRTAEQKNKKPATVGLENIGGAENQGYEKDQTISRAVQPNSDSCHKHQERLDSNVKRFSEPNCASQIALHDADVIPKPSKHSSCAKCCTCSLLDLFNVTLLTNFYFLLLLLAYFFLGTAYIIVIHYSTVRAVNAGITELNAAYLLSAIGITSLLSRLTHGYIIDYHVMSATVLTAIAFAICGISSALNPISDLYSMLLSLSVMFGITSGVFNSTVPLITKEYVGAKQVSAGTGCILLMIGISSILGAYMTGFLVDATGSYDIPFYLAGGCFIICSLLIFAFPGFKYLKHHQRRQKDISFTNS